MTTQGFLDAPTAGSEVAPGLIRVVGWASLAPADVARVELRVNGENAGRARIAQLRPDVVEALGDPGLSWTGFEQFVPVPAYGPSRIVAVAQGTGGTTIELATSINVRGSGVSSRQTAFRFVGLQDLTPSRWFRRRRPAHPTKVLVVAHSMELAGAELSLLDLVARLAADEGFSIDVAAVRDGPLRERFASLGIPVQVVGAIATDDVGRYEHAVDQLARLAGQADVLLANTLVTFPAVDAATRAGIPVVWAIHEGWGVPLFWDACYPPGALDRHVRRRAERALRHVAATVFVADATRLACTRWIDPSPSYTIPYGVDFAAIEREEGGEPRAVLRRRLGLAPEADVLLTVGPIRPPKGQSLLGHAFRAVAGAHPHAMLVLLGDADHLYARALRDWLAGLGLADRVRFEPPTADIGAWYRAADWLVVPSDVESLPRTIVEAAARGVPAAATDVGGIAELVDDGASGLLCPANDLEAMTRLLERALATPGDQRQALAAACAERARRRHDPAACARAYADLLRQAVSSNRPRMRFSVFGASA